ncbi:MAG: putative sulfate exporter family transporter [Kiritimatiellae bacterium]|nr:putative sulfate exporter family transporter [Kiritimatiellia bacterium]MBR3823399.1 putative sulfate exporter family transporter [Kiritimatiellia bacterium]
MSEKKSIIQTVAAVALCATIGILSQNTTGLQKAAFGRVIVGGPMLALLVSMIACNILPSLSKGFKEGTSLCAKKFLNWGIVATGGTLSFAAIMGTGVKALPLIILNIFISFAAAIWIGRKVLNVSDNTAVLVGGGTCICGGTAIATLSRIIKASAEEIAFAMAAIFLFDTLAAFAYPYIISALGFTSGQFAFIAGTAINDTSSVAGAQATYQAIIGDPGFQGALNVKLVRTTMLIFVALAWTLVMSAKAKRTGEAAATDSAFAVVKKTFPMFILVFAAMAALNTMGFFSADGVKMLGNAGKYLFAGALAGVGFKIKFSEVFSKGVKPITLGGITWACVAISSFLFAVLFKGYID